MRRGQARVFKIQFQSHGGLIFGPGNVSVSPQTLTRLMIDKTARRVTVGMIFLFFFFAVERWESNKERALMRRCVTLETIRRDDRAGSLFNEVVIWGRELWGDFPC